MKGLVKVSSPSPLPELAQSQSWKVENLVSWGGSTSHADKLSIRSRQQGDAMRFQRQIRLLHTNAEMKKHTYMELWKLLRVPPPLFHFVPLFQQSQQHSQ